MKIPNSEHWAIITSSNIYVPGDERSRTNPGHGYPEHYVESIGYESFTDFDTFEDRVMTLTSRGSTFRAIKATPTKIAISVT